jgi:SsrA-binding protein
MSAQPTKSIIENKKSLFDYEVIEEFEAGIVLIGSEVKSIRNGSANLK